VKVIRWSVLVVVTVVVGYPLLVAFQVWQQSHRDEVRGADAIVVLGAAQYDGRPSPVYEARLDQALYLYEQDLSDIVVTTGGKQPGDRFTESEAGERYLVDHGVPPEAILGEDDGETTLQSLQNVREIAPQHGVSSVLLVSDPLHSERIKLIATDLGFEEAYASPASYVELSRSRPTKARELLREVVSVIAYRLLDR
jgi:uncharacterized SAM-binding protein YcdF (DUF218 family)